MRKKRNRRNLRKWVLSNLFHQFANMTDITPLMRKIRKKTDVTRDVPYHPDGRKAHLMDIYRPQNRTGPLPVLLYVHGGGFSLCSKETHRGAALLLSRFGFMVCNINYRLAPKYRYPAALEDAAQAYQWVAAHAGEYGGDPSRLSLAGESAGANLVLGLTLAACYERPEPFARSIRATGVRPRTVQVIQGLLQVSDPHRFNNMDRKGRSGPMDSLSADIIRDVARAYLGRNYKHHDPETALADPLVILERAGQPSCPLPPVFAAVGTADILHDDTRRLEAALRGRTDLAVVRYYPDEPHVFHFVSWRKHTRRFWTDCKGFLDQHAV